MDSCRLCPHIYIGQFFGNTLLVFFVQRHLAVRAQLALGRLLQLGHVVTIALAILLHHAIVCITTLLIFSRLCCSRTRASEQLRD